jgi:hypothetical protein
MVPIITMFTSPLCGRSVRVWGAVPDTLLRSLANADATVDTVGESRESTIIAAGLWFSIKGKLPVIVPLLKLTSGESADCCANAKPGDENRTKISRERND